MILAWIVPTLIILLALVAKLLVWMASVPKSGWGRALAFGVAVTLGWGLFWYPVFERLPGKAVSAAVLLALSATAGAFVLAPSNRPRGAALGATAGLFVCVLPFLAMVYFAELVFKGRIG